MPSSSSPNLLRFSFSGNWSRPGVAAVALSLSLQSLFHHIFCLRFWWLSVMRRGRERPARAHKVHWQFAAGWMEREEDGWYSVGRVWNSHEVWRSISWIGKSKTNNIMPFFSSFSSLKYPPSYIDVWKGTHHHQLRGILPLVAPTMIG